MTICFKGQLLCFAEDPRPAVQSLALTMLSAIQQSYPERLSK